MKIHKWNSLRCFCTYWFSLSYSSISCTAIFLTYKVWLNCWMWVGSNTRGFANFYGSFLYWFSMETEIPLELTKYTNLAKYRQIRVASMTDWLTYACICHRHHQRVIWSSLTYNRKSKQFKWHARNIKLHVSETWAFQGECDLKLNAGGCFIFSKFKEKEAEGGGGLIWVNMVIVQVSSSCW